MGNNPNNMDAQHHDDEPVGEDTIDFGYERVARSDKKRRVGAVFDSVADRYDLMNDLMSFGIHRAWKHFTLQLAAVRAGDRVLDLAGGTGDLAAGFARRVGDEGRVTLSDINASMLARGRERLLDRGVVGRLDYVLAPPAHWPFPDTALQPSPTAVRLRNATDQQAALIDLARATGPGGPTIVLEFSKPQVPRLSKLYDL